MTCTLPTLANAGTWAITVNVTVNASTPGGTYTNTATVSTTTADPVPGNDSASQPTTVNTTADLSIAKTDSADPVNPGQAFTYTLTVTNNGPSDASGLTVSDTVPPQFTVTGASSGAGSCGNVGNVVTCTLPTLANAGTWAITVNVTVNASTPGGTYTNTATVSTTTADPVPGNDSASQPTTVNTTADLSIAKTDSADPVNPGQAFTYTLTVTNNGPSDASGLTVSDTVPVGFTISSVTSALGSCGYVGNLAICTLPLLPLSGTWTITVNVTVNASTPGGLYTNTATVSTTTADPAPGNNTATEDTVVTPAADLSIAKTDSADPVNPGQAFTYTLTVTNNGPSDASGLTVSDTVPPQFTVTGASSGAGSCGNVGNVVTCTLPTLANAGTWAITVNVTVNASTPGGTYTNTATVSTTTADPVPGNDSASQPTTVGSSSDLAITKSDGVVSVSLGASVTYAITLTNNGPPAAPAGITITDTIPSGTTATESEVDCSISGSVFTCATSAVLVVGASVTYRLTVAVPAGYGPTMLSNSATIASSPIPDANAANDTATDIDTVTALSADLSVAKTDSADPVDPGQSFNYAIVVTNAGPDAATNVVVTDTVPPSVSVTGVDSTQGSCTAAGNAVTCSLPSLAAAATWTITIHAKVPVGAPPATVSNTATVAGVGDTDPANDSASQSTTIGGVADSSDLTVTKTVSDASPQEGDTIIYDVTVTNNGPDDATGVQVTDALPAGLSFVSADASAGSYDEASGVWNVGPLAMGERAQLQMRVSVDAGTAGTTIANGAAVSGADQSDPNGGNDADAAPVGVSPAGGGTAFTGFPAGPGPFAWMIGLAVIGLAAVVSGRRRAKPRRRRPSSGRFLAQPFFFDQS